ncbi:hypothetical protein GEMRC1_003684 [Eukaryota sp. GEM-RC1]
MSKRHASTEDEPQNKITNDFDDDFLPFEYEVLSGDAAASFLSDLPDQPTETPSTSEPSNSVRLASKKSKERKKIIKQPKNTLSMIHSTSADDTASSFDLQSSQWYTQLSLHPSLCLSLHHLSINTPNQVQLATVPLFFQDHDIAVAAETGSGKTFAFALPLIHLLLSEKFSRKGPNVVVIAPTRELSTQITDVFKVLLSFDDALAKEVVCITGGLAHEKQIKILNKKRPRIIVGTVGRLLEILSKGMSDWLTVEKLNF